MKMAVIGAGAIGGLVGAKLAAAGDDVTVIVRGAHLEAIRQHGVRLIDGRRQRAPGARHRGDQRLRRAGVQDLVILAVKAHQVEPSSTTCRSCSAQTVVVTMQNGIPCWYFHRHGGALEGTREERRPERAHRPTIPAERVHRLRASTRPPSWSRRGVVKHIEGDRFPLGELDGTISERVSASPSASSTAGLQGADARQHPRRDLAQAVGQPDLQPDQRADACDARRHLPVSR